MSLSMLFPKVLRWRKLSGEKMMSLGIIHAHVVVSNSIKVEEAVR